MHVCMYVCVCMRYSVQLACPAILLIFSLLTVCAELKTVEISLIESKLMRAACPSHDIQLKLILLSEIGNCIALQYIKKTLC